MASRSLLLQEDLRLGALLSFLVIMGLSTNSCSFLGKAFELVLVLVMPSEFIGFSLGLPPAKVNSLLHLRLAYEIKSNDVHTESSHAIEEHVGPTSPRLLCETSVHTAFSLNP